MVDKEIQIIKDQINKIDSKDFDLDSWKIFTINILERIFGPTSHKIDQIKELKYDFSSWSLRDTSGSAGSIKKKARVILESSINELESFGLPVEEKNTATNSSEMILNVFSDELKGSQYKRLREIIELKDESEKRKEFKQLLAEIETEAKESLILGILLKL